MSRNRTLQPVAYRQRENSAAYNQLVEHIFRLQAIVSMQRIFRKSRTRVWNNPHSYVVSQSVRRVILEPRDDVYLVYANRVLQGRYHDLNFCDPRFVFHLFKALRLGKITLNQLLMAQNIYYAKKWLHDDQFSYSSIPHLKKYNLLDQNSPYRPSEIIYATPAQIKNFYSSLRTEEDRGYYLIQFTKKAEHAFFEIALQHFILYPHYFVKALTYYFYHHRAQLISPQHHEKFLSIFGNDYFIQIDEDKITLCAQALVELRQCSGYCHGDLDDTTTHLLIAALRLFEQIPAIILSPDYNPMNSDSPILSFVLLTQAALVQLQKAVHGEDIALPYPVVGQFDPRLIRALLDDASAPEDCRNTMRALYPFLPTNGQRYRPIEIVHPNVISNPKPHNTRVHYFMLTYHDYWHMWRIGTNHHAFYQYLRNFFSRYAVYNKKLLVMNKMLWELSDMDFNSGLYSRITQDQYRQFFNQRDSLSVYFFSEIVAMLNVLNKKRDMILLLCIDMLQNQPQWKIFVEPILKSQGITVKSFDEFVLQTHHEPMTENLLLERELIVLFLHPELGRLVECHRDKCPEWIMLRYITRQCQFSASLCEAVEHIGIEKLFTWERDGGLTVHPSLKKNVEQEFPRLPEGELTCSSDFLAILFFLIREQEIKKEVYAQLLLQVPLSELEETLQCYPNLLSKLRDDIFCFAEANPRFLGSFEIMMDYLNQSHVKSSIFKKMVNQVVLLLQSSGHFLQLITQLDMDSITALLDHPSLTKEACTRFFAVLRPEQLKIFENRLDILEFFSYHDKTKEAFILAKNNLHAANPPRLRRRLYFYSSTPPDDVISNGTVSRDVAKSEQKCA